MFTDLGLNKQLLTAIEELGYEEPTEIQRRAIPPILSGNHVIGVAPTGTGKTAAFVLPILRKLNYAQAHDPRCLIFLPSRELAHQVYENCLEFGKYTDLRFVKLTGGNGIQAQRLALEDGADVIIATPGRFMDLYFEGAVRLRSVEILVLDEADKMMDMGFMPQLNQILEVIPTKRQNILFSATFHSSVEKLSEDFLEFPVKIEIDKNAKTLTITDSGIGLSEQEAIDNLGTIAKSGTRDFVSKLSGDEKSDSQLIGQFGVGFYAGFIVADKITVESRRAGLNSQQAVRWTSQGTGEFEVETIEREQRGTSVILHLRDDAQDYLNTKTFANNTNLRSISSSNNDA